MTYMTRVFVVAHSYMMEILRNDQPYADVTGELEVEEGGVYTVVLFLDSFPGSSVQVRITLN
jgi:hypothetical protein